MKTPGFFLVGAPKCGTTALYHYLSRHPKIFLPAFKEPHYFAADLRTPDYVRSRQVYLDLFRQAGDEHQAVGEGSVWYLYSEVAARGIRRFAPDAKLIVMFRRPLEMFVSLHNQAVFSLFEDEPDPERAWGLQDQRCRGQQVPALCEEPRLLLYGPACRLGAQLERLLGVFPLRRVHPIVFDDFTRDPGSVYRGVLDFLGVPDDHRSAFPRINEAHGTRSLRLAKLHRRIDRKLLVSPTWRRLLGPLRPLSRALRRHNVKPVAKPELRPEFRRRLAEYFAPDVEKLEGLLSRDLSSWKDPDGSPYRFDSS